MLRNRCHGRIRGAYWSGVGLSAVVGTAVLTSQALAEPMVPADSKWSLRVDVAQAHQSRLGTMLMDIIRTESPETDATLDGLSESLGLDPRKDVGQVVLFGNGFEEMDLRLVADLGTSTGKLEGWVLALPGYESQDLDDDTLLHSFLVEDKHGGPPHGHHRPEDIELGRRAHDGKPSPMHRMFAAMPQSTDGRYTLVLAFDKGTVINLAKQARTQPQTLADSAMKPGSLAELAINDLSGLPMQPTDPGSAIVRSLKAALLSVGSDDQFTAALELTATSPARARQVQSLLSGLLALPQIAAAQEPEAQIVANLASRVAVQHTEGQPTVSAHFTCEHNELRNMLQSVAELHERGPHHGPPKGEGFGEF